MTIRPATRADEDAIWSIFHTVVARGDTYVFDPKMPREEALGYWLHPGTHAYVGETGDGLDALVASLTARAAAQDRTLLPRAEQADLAWREGWIHLPTAFPSP